MNSTRQAVAADPAGERRNEVRAAAGAAALALVTTLAVYHRGLGFPFALDDYTYLYKAAGIDPVHFELRRWLTIRGYFELGLHLFGLSTLPWHLVSFALHVANAVWVYLLARRFGCSRQAGWVASGLFASSPVAFTVVYWVAGIQELASGFFLLGATYVALLEGRRRWWSVALFAAAMLCKESVLAAPLALLCVLGRRGLPLAGAHLAAGVALFVCSGLHHRVLDESTLSPYATAYGGALFVNLATLWFWFVTPWRAYPDRVASPDPALAMPGLAIAGGVIVAAIWSGWQRARLVALAAVWFVALLLPVLPLRSHSYAYYLYLPQIGFLILIGAGCDRLARRLAAGGWRWLPRVAAVGLWALFAARTARTHETLLLGRSDVPHDSVVRYARVAGDIVHQLRAQRLPARVHRVAVIGFQTPGEAAHTPGSDIKGGKRIQVVPMRAVMADGKLVRLHFPQLQGAFVDSLSARDDSLDTAIFFGSGISHLEYVPDPADAHTMWARAEDYLGDRRATERSLRRALQIAPGHLAARIFLAELLARSPERRAEAADLVGGIDPAHVPDELRPVLAQIQRALAAGRPR